MTDKPTNDDEGPITPDSVQQPRRGAAGRKRRSGGDTGDTGGADAGAGDLSDLSGAGDPPARSRSTGTMFRAGCLALIALGVLSLILAGRYVLDPESAQCTLARAAIEDANDDDEDFNDVTLPEGIDDVDDLDCAEAVELAGGIPAEEDEEADGEFVTESALRTQGLLVSGIGIGQAVFGFLTLRTQRKRMRTVALVFTALGILLPVLQLISVVLLAFVVFALVFSADAKAIFGQSSLFRPRPPRQSG